MSAASYRPFHVWQLHFRNVSIPVKKTNQFLTLFPFLIYLPSCALCPTSENLFLTLQTFIIYLKFVCLSQITLHLDRRTICQKVNNFSIVNRNSHIYVVRCSSTKSILHVKASAAALMLSPASQE